MNKIKIHCFDDQEDDAKWMKIAICPYHNQDEDFRKDWTDKNINWKRFETVGEAIAYYENTKDYPDIISIDIDASELRHDYVEPEELNSLIPIGYRGNERDITRGAALMKYANEKFPSCISFFITGQAQKPPVLDEAVNAAIQSGILTVHKGRGYLYIQEKIFDDLKIVAKKYFYKLNSLSKSELKDKLYSLDKESFLLLIVNIGGDDYQLKDILIPYCLLDEVEFRAEINKMLILDLTLAASECFGILGIKQITHDTDDYYYTDERLFEKIKNQINSFDQIINEISDKSIKDKLLSFENNIKEFSKIFEKNCDQTFNQELREKRNLNFQFKGDRFDEILGQDKNVPTDNSNFELNIPIQEIFNTEFKLFIESILERSGKGAWATTYNWFNLATTESAEKVDGYEIKLWNNFICFYHDGKNIFDPENTSHYRADWLKSFQKSLDYFGKLYILKKDIDNEYTVFDCTYDSVIKIGEYSEWKCLLKDNSKMKDVVNLQKNNYFIFSFLTKKPKN